MELLLELPFLTLTDDGEALLLEDVDKMAKCLKRGKSKAYCISNGAMEQSRKMIQNARFEMANNRVLFSNELVCKAVKELNRLLPHLEPPLIPQFALRKSLDNKPPFPYGVEGIYPYGSKEFDEIIKDLPDGLLYHGTSKLNNVLNIIGNGLLYSKAETDSIGVKSGAAAFGDGVYTSGLLRVSASYTGLNGIVLPFKLSQHPDLRILDYKIFSEGKKGSKIIQKANQYDMNVNQYLADQFGIDIIYNRHMIVMNSMALRRPKSINDLLDHYYSSIKSDVASDDDGTMVTKFQVYSGFYRLRIALGLEEHHLH